MKLPERKNRDRDEYTKEMQHQSLWEAISNKEVNVRRQEIATLGKKGDPVYLEVFIPALYDDDKGVREAATSALVTLGSIAVNPLLDIIRSEADWKVRYRAAEALGMIGDEIATIPLIGLLSDNKDHLRYMAAKSLGVLKAEVARDSLYKCLSDENAYVRAMAKKALLKIEN